MTPLHCSNCAGNHHRVGQRYCAACHAAYQRKWRYLKRRELSDPVVADCLAQLRKLRSAGVPREAPT